MRWRSTWRGPPEISGILVHVKGKARAHVRDIACFAGGEAGAASSLSSRRMAKILLVSRQLERGSSGQSTGVRTHPRQKRT